MLKKVTLPPESVATIRWIKRQLDECERLAARETGGFLRLNREQFLHHALLLETQDAARALRVLVESPEYVSRDYIPAGPRLN